MATAKYYLGRVLKLGNLTHEGMIKAIQDPATIQRGNYLFTFTDISYVKGVADYDFVFAKLAKFAPEGEIEVVEPEKHVATAVDAPNLLYASSPFVYIPEYSGIAYQHIWNKLPSEQFEKAFAGLIEEKYEGFFVEAKVEPIADLQTFIQRVSTLEVVYKMDARVHPPNPLFGAAWRSLRSYIQRRKLGEIQMKEEAETDAGIATNLPRIADLVLKQPKVDESEIQRLLEPFESGIGDAAVLMAADGYGRAKVEGRRNEQRIVVRTKENQIAFDFDRDPDPVELASEAIKILKRINDDRYLDHP